MPRLWDSTVSGNCYKVRLMLAHLGIDYEAIPIDVASRDPRPAGLLADNPLGKVPKLELDDGGALVESDAILWHLAEGTPYLPDEADDRLDVMRWLFFEQNIHESSIAVRRFILHYLPEKAHNESVLKYLYLRGTQALDAMEKHLKENAFFSASRYTIADIALYAYTHVAGEGGFDLDSYPAIVAWFARVRDQPGHVVLDPAAG